MTDIRPLLESIGKISEAPSDELVDNINSVIAGLSDTPTRNEIESAIDKVENIDAGFGATKGYKEREFLGRLADKLGVDGLYTFPGGRTLVTTDKDEKGNYNSTFVIGAGDLNLNKSIAEISLGLFPKPRLDKIKEKHPDEEVFKKPEDDEEESGDSDSKDSESGDSKNSTGELASLNTTVNLTDPEDIENKVGDLLGQYRELIRKMNESAPVSIRGYLKEYGLMLEDLSRDEALRLQAIYNDLEMLTQTPEVPDDVKNSISSEIDDAPEVARGVTTPADPPEEIEGEPLEPTGDEEDNSGEEKNTDNDDDEEEPAQEPDREPSGSLAKFAQSGEKGLANNPEEKETIEELQQFLTDLGYDTRGVDGIYGGGTTESVKGFQEAFGLTADGDAGPNTIQVIQDYKNDMEQLDYLLGKLDTDNKSNESNDLRHLIAIVESKLFETLNDDEKARAQAIIDKYSGIVDNLPSQAQEELGSKLEQLEAGTEQSTDDNADNAEPAADAAYKTVEGSGRNRSYTTYDKDGNEIDSGMGFGPRNLPSKEEFEQQQSGEQDNTSGSNNNAEPPADSGDDSVEPRPTGNSRRDRREQQVWDRQYSDTHNPDGSLKNDESGQQGEEEPQAQTPQEPEQQSSWLNRIKSAGEPTNASEAAAFVTNIPENERSQYRAQLSPQEQELFDRMASGET